MIICPETRKKFLPEKTACPFLTSRKRSLYFRADEMASDNRLKYGLSFEKETDSRGMQPVCCTDSIFLSEG